MFSCCSGEHNASHRHEDPNAGQKASLYEKIDTQSLVAFNTSSDPKVVFKPWTERLDVDKFVESENDEELLFFVPFTGMVKLQSILVRGYPSAHSPSKLKVTVNNDNVDFSSIEDCTFQQEWDLVPDCNQVIEYPTRVARFADVRNISLFFSSNYGEETTKVAYIGFKGEWKEYTRKAVEVVYEAAPNPADHKKTQLEFSNTYNVK